MTRRQDKYLPALNYDWLTPLYDFLIRWTFPESTIKRRLIAQARIGKGQRVLDLGCGTATLTLILKRTHADAEVVGLDGDPKILSIARAKVGAAGAQIRLDLGMAYELPYPPESFDRVVSTFVFHHLTPENRRRTAVEVLRVLRAGGELHVADFGRPHNGLMRAIAFLMRLTHSAELTADNLAGRLPEIFSEAGFVDAQKTSHYATVFGTLDFYQARKPPLAGYTAAPL